MIDAFASRLPFSPRRSGGLVTPFFQTVRTEKIDRLSLNFLRFAWFFERGLPPKRIANFSFFLLRAFAKGEVYPERLQGSRRAPSREINRASPHALRSQGVHAKARRGKRYAFR
jgi:hypothetical protein